MTASIHLHGALNHAQAAQVLREIGAQLRQDGRGNLRVVPVIQECPRCWATYSGRVCPICSPEPEAA